MKKAILILSSLIILSILGVFAYLYYIKPQRQYISILTQNCINKAMEPINTETVKYSPNPYKTTAGFNAMLETQSVEVEKCMTNYDIILFSSAERNLFRLDLDSKIGAQQAAINSYTSKINQRLAEIKSQQDQQKACSDMKSEYKSYQDCVSAETKKGNAYYSSTDYFQSMPMSMLGSSSNNGDISKDICLQKYNFKRFGVDDWGCAMMGITY